MVKDDIALAHRARRDADVADRLLYRLQPRVWQVVRMIRSSRHEAEELCQICMIKILENLHKYRGEGSLESWAGQVAYRVSMRYGKTLRRREIRERPLPEELEMPESGSGSDASPELVASRTEVWRRLSDEMDKKSPERRISLLLHLAEGYTVEEVAEITGVSANTTKDRLRTAYVELRAVFARNISLKREILEVIHG
jgi:RNA polymerase sigma factor (sigma-70 family)